MSDDHPSHETKHNILKRIAFNFKFHYTYSYISYNLKISSVKTNPNFKTIALNGSYLYRLCSRQFKYLLLLRCFNLHLWCVHYVIGHVH